MRKVQNGFYAAARAISPENLHIPTNMDTNVLKPKKNASRFWILSMIIERPDGKGDIENQINKRSNGGGGCGELESILPQGPPVEEVCLLRDSPFRILRSIKVLEEDLSQEMYKRMEQGTFPGGKRGFSIL